MEPPLYHRYPRKSVVGATLDHPRVKLSDHEFRRRWLHDQSASINRPPDISSEDEDDDEGSDSELPDNYRRESRASAQRGIWALEDVQRRLREMLPRRELSTEFFLSIEQQDITGLQSNWENVLDDVEMNAGLLHANLKGLIGSTRYFLDVGVDANACDPEGRSALHLAASSGVSDCVRLLLDKGAVVNVWEKFNKTTPLMCAASSGSTECLKLLINNGADINAGLDQYGNSALHYAVRADAADCVKLLLHENARPNSTIVCSENPLHITAAAGYIECMRVLLDYGADVVASCGPSKMTALHLGTEDGNVEATRMLLAAGASPNAVNNRKQTSLHLAALAQSAETVELLLKHGADPDAEDFDRRTPIHSAIVKGSRSFECMRLMLEAGAKVNHQDKYGYSPLHIAAINEFSYCVNLLIQFGGDVTARTKGGMSAFSFIVRRCPDVLPKIGEKLDSTIRLNDRDINDPDCEMKMDFRMLVPNSKHGESQLFLCLIEERQKHFLKHPVCESFLHLKWQKLRKFFLVYLVFYAVFVGLFTVYIINVFPNPCEYKKMCKPVDKDNVVMNGKTMSGVKCFKEMQKECMNKASIIVDWCILLGLTLLMMCKEIFQIQNHSSLVSSIPN